MNFIILGSFLGLYPMMFKGTPTRTAFDIARETEECGGDMSAYTYFEETAYYFTSPASKIETIIQVYADALHNSLFSEEDWAKEKDVILGKV